MKYLRSILGFTLYAGLLFLGYYFENEGFNRVFALFVWLNVLILVTSLPGFDDQSIAMKKLAVKRWTSRYANLRGWGFVLLMLSTAYIGMWLSVMGLFICLLSLAAIALQVDQVRPYIEGEDE